MRSVVGGLALTLLAGCGSALPRTIDALPAEVGGFERAEQPLADDGRLAAALEAVGLSADDMTGHEARWGDDIRLVALTFDAVSLDDASRVARALLGIGGVTSAMEVVADQTLFELNGPSVEGVAYQFTVSGGGNESLMYTVIAPSMADAEPVIRAISAAIEADN